jgi:hypothetical protein
MSTPATPRGGHLARLTPERALALDLAVNHPDLLGQLARRAALDLPLDCRAAVDALEGHLRDRARGLGLPPLAEAALAEYEARRAPTPDPSIPSDVEVVL